MKLARFAAGFAATAAAVALMVAGAGAASASDSQRPDWNDDSQVGDVLSNNNINALPVLLCNVDATGIGGTVPILSPEQTGDCTNSPIVSPADNLSQAQRDSYTNEPQVDDVLSDNNINALPVLLCNVDAVGIGAIVPVLSPKQTHDCTNSVIVDETKK